jgi:hypothetical protein
MSARRDIAPPPHPPGLPQSPRQDLHFRTENTNLSAYLIAAEKLHLKAAELAPSGVVEFVFDDPDGLGPDLLSRYSVGACDSVNARVLFETRAYLLTQVRKVQKVAGVDRAQR